MQLMLVSHGDFAKEILKSAEMIMGKFTDVVEFGLEPDDGPQELSEKIAAFLKTLSKDEIVIVMVDLLGGTPSNVITKLLSSDYPNLNIISGLNLPMLVAFMNQKFLGQPFDKAALIAAGKEGVVDVNEKITALADSDDED
ncbi:PTS sugar transporter subunit IIA [Lacticaseibacillus rhamnosus]|uniref:PTS sugar transporter subunit IIA n=1 Tax=Lacticaseibacillus rhamnosus TaxID=47715 RepID=UPI0023E319F7|nr:PTS sugar transporter subunit IIA [Lacticaseibacillus rhamnosus]MDF3335690.1 PTS sugar transporter subunit IIA [Lacticaseibacillus rhamnosus]